LSITPLAAGPFLRLPLKNGHHDAVVSSPSQLYLCVIKIVPLSQSLQMYPVLGKTRAHLRHSPPCLEESCGFNPAALHRPRLSIARSREHKIEDSVCRTSVPGVCGNTQSFSKRD